MQGPYQAGARAKSDNLDDLMTVQGRPSTWLRRAIVTVFSGT